MSKKSRDNEDIGGDFTITNMNVEGMPNYTSEERKQEIREIRKLNLTKAEKRAIFWGSFRALIPLLGFIIVGFTLAYFFCVAWFT